MNMTNRRACVNAAYGNLSAAMAKYDTKPETPDCRGEIFMISST